MFDIHATSAAAYLIAIDGDEFRFRGVNQACIAMVGIVDAFHPGLTPRDIFPQPVAEAIVERYRACRDTRQAVSYSSQIRNGQSWRTTLFPLLDQAGRVTAIVGICAPPDVESSSPTRAEPPPETAKLVLNTMDGGFWIYEIATGHFETSVQLAELIAGPGRTSLNLAEFISCVYPEDLGGKNALDLDGDRSEAMHRVIVFDGRTRWLRSGRRIVRDEDGTPVRVVGIVSDVTEQQRQIIALECEASTDPLTSLKNRRSFDRALGVAFNASRKANKSLGLLLIDLDGFKPINDRFGHRAGDVILCKVAQRLKRYLREADLLARIGGDEFALLVAETSVTRLASLADRIDRAFSKPFLLDGAVVYVGISIGTAVSSAGNKTVEALFERADRCLYATKRERQALSA